MPEREDPLASLRDERAALLDRILATLAGDERVAAAWLSGSVGRGEADAWSDLDLHLAVVDQSFETFLSERTRLYDRVGQPLLVQGEMPSDSQAAARFQLVIFAGPVEVDWNIGPLSRAERPEASAVLFDRAGIPLMAPPRLSLEQRRGRAEDRLIFIWAMAPIAVKYAGRGDSRRAAGQIGLLTNALISLWRLAYEPDGPEPYLPATNRPLEAALDARLPVLGQTIDPSAALDVIARLCQETESLHSLLAALGVPIPRMMPGQLHAMIAIAGAAIRAGDLPRRRFR